MRLIASFCLPFQLRSRKKHWRGTCYKAWARHFARGLLGNWEGFVKRLIGVASIAVVFGSATAFADPDPTRVPLANAIEKNTENSAKNPQARGLQNAREHLLDNARRQQEKRANHPPGQQKKA